MDFSAVRYAATKNNIQHNNQFHVHGIVAKVSHIWRSIPLQYSFSLISALVSTFLSLMPYPLTITYKTAPSTHLQDHLVPQPQSQSTIPQNKDHSSQNCSLLYPEDGDSTFLCDTAHMYLTAGSTPSRLPGSLRHPLSKIGYTGSSSPAFQMKCSTLLYVVFWQSPGFTKWSPQWHHHITHVRLFHLRHGTICRWDYLLAPVSTVSLSSSWFHISLSRDFACFSLSMTFRKLFPLYLHYLYTFISFCQSYYHKHFLACLLPAFAGEIM